MTDDARHRLRSPERVQSGDGHRIVKHRATKFGEGRCAALGALAKIDGRHRFWLGAPRKFDDGQRFA